jgi:hypothetical protein
VAFQSYADVEAALKAESDVWSKGQGHTDAAVRQRALAAREWWANYQAPKTQPPSPSSPSAYTPTTSTTPPPPTPPAWIRTSDFQEPRGVKQADPDIVIFNTESISPEFLVELNYEDLSGMELINISRSDLINGVDVVYSPIKNLSALRRRYSPNNIISMPELSSSYFARFGIDLILRGIKKPFFDNQGNLVVEIEDVKDDELIEIEISQSGTINEVEFL